MLLRRSILASLGAAAAGSVQAACGGSHVAAPKLDTSKQVSLKLAVRGGQVDSKLWPEAAADFNRRFRNIQVDIEDYPSREFHEKLLALTAANSQPDVMQSSDEPFFEFADKGVWLDIGKFVERDRRALKTEDWIPGALDFWRWDPKTKSAGKGTLFGVPRAAGTELLVYNKQVFTEAGVPEPPADGNWTWNDFLERSRKLVKRQGDELVRAAMPMPGLRSTIAWLISHGAPNLADPVKRVSTMNNPVTIQVLGTVAGYRLKDRIIPSVAELKGSTFKGNVYQLLAKGTYAMVPNIGYLFNFREAFKDNPDSWDVAHMPKGPKGPAARGAWSPFAAGAQTTHPAEAWEFMKYATGPEGQATLLRLGYLFSVRKSVAQQVFVDPKTPQHEQRWIEATRYQHFEPLSDVYPKLQKVHNFYWNQIADEQVRRPINESVRLIDETANKIFQGGDIPADWEGQAK